MEALAAIVTDHVPHLAEYAQITNNPENDGCINAVLCKSSFSVAAGMRILMIRPCSGVNMFATIDPSGRWILFCCIAHIHVY